MQILPAGRYAVYSAEVVNNDFDSPWADLMRSLLPFSGYQPADGPRFEVYHTDGSDAPDGRWEIDVCLPSHRSELPVDVVRNEKSTNGNTDRTEGNATRVDES